eukprot:7322821-Pyramimonas_sp.AAC.1
MARPRKTLRPLAAQVPPVAAPSSCRSCLARSSSSSGLLKFLPCLPLPRPNVARPDLSAELQAARVALRAAKEGGIALRPRCSPV